MKDTRSKADVSGAMVTKDPVRGPIKLIAGVCILLSVGLATLWSLKTREVASTPEPTVESDASTGAAHNEASSAEVEDVVQVQAPSAPVEAIASMTVTRSGGVARPRTPRAEPSAQTRQLVSALTQIDFGTELTSERVALWRQGFQELVRQGSAAVPAIREFLEENKDWYFPSGNALGFSSLRTAFFDALAQIGGPEAQGLMVETLQSTSAPTDIARLAYYLEQQAPGQFRDDITAATRATLAQAASGQLKGWDVGPLFNVLQNYGDPGTAAELEASASKWNYYATLALANLPSEEGVPSLIRLAQDSPSPGTRSAAVEALAQVAGQSPEAGVALLALLRSGKVSDRSWLAAAAAIGGEQRFIANNGLGNPVPVGGGVKSYHLEFSNQDFYSMPMTGTLSAEQAGQRVDLIDQMLAANPSPTVVQALQNARTTLQPKQ